MSHKPHLNPLPDVNQHMPEVDLETRIVNALAKRKKIGLNSEGLRRASVLVPLLKRSDEYCMLFTKRPKELKSHPGQISFPGGLFEDHDVTPKGTAIREAREELGILESDIQFLGELDDYASTTGYLISPFVGKIPYPYDFKINEEEVTGIIFVPIEELRKPPKVGYSIREGKPYPVYYYELPEHVVWGATARVVKNFIEAIFTG
jgi:8-oxo-dGTP pyrophosphatase MutT (NUDIX family)